MITFIKKRIPKKKEEKKTPFVIQNIGIMDRETSRYVIEKQLLH